MVIFSSFGLAILLFLLKWESVTTDEIIYDRVELLNSSSLEGIYNFTEFRITKFNRTLFVINSKIELLQDLDETFEVEVLFYFNRLNNNQYTKSIARVKRDKLCIVATKFQDALFTNLNKDKTNLPPEGVGYCPLKKVVII